MSHFSKWNRIMQPGNTNTPCVPPWAKRLENYFDVGHYGKSFGSSRGRYCSGKTQFLPGLRTWQGELDFSSYVHPCPIIACMTAWWPRSEVPRKPSDTGNCDWGQPSLVGLPLALCPSSSPVPFFPVYSVFLLP